MLDPTRIESVEVVVSADLRERVVSDCLGEAGVYLSCCDGLMAGAGWEGLENC
jgi:hypothetical protein